jgi:hypothetical protein
MTKAGEWHDRLAARAAVLSGPIRALAKREERVHASTPAYAWPLEPSIAETPGLTFEPSYSDPPPPGVLFEGADATALHALRVRAHADYKEARENDILAPSPVFVDHDSRGYFFTFATSCQRTRQPRSALSSHCQRPERCRRRPLAVRMQASSRSRETSASAVRLAPRGCWTPSRAQCVAPLM